MLNGNTSIESDDSLIVKSRRAIEASDDQGVAVAEDIGTGGPLSGEGAEGDDPSFPRVKNSDLGEDLDVGRNEIVDAKIYRAVAAGGSDNLTEIVDEIVDEIVVGTVVDDSKVPRDPPITPAIEERIWWKNDFIVIKKSTLGGLGVFAAKDLEYGDKILEEMPLLHTNNWGISNKYDSLSDEDRELLHTLHKFSTNPSAHVLEKIRRANSFQLPKGVAIYSVASRFNHACLPIRNVNYVINGRGDAKITFTVSKNVPKGTELTICYGGRPEQLLRGFGFRCKCGGCDSLTDKEVESIMKTLRGDGNWTNPCFVALVNLIFVRQKPI
ncbi:SET domain-containing protein [Coniochaeta sp. PMI_546]|nr:SET domain-containing protein [Coniochaeta sp. PMI_546]